MSNLVEKNQIDDLKFITINDIIQSQNLGELNFTISDGSFQSVKLHAKKVDYIDSNNYSWSGTDLNDSFSATFIKDKNGFSGSIYHFQQNQIYRILPIGNNTSALCKMFTPSHNHEVCGSTPMMPPQRNEIVDSENNCPAHVDFLFLLTPDVQYWMVNNNMNYTFLNMLISELEFTFANSNINHTIDFTWDELDWQNGYDSDDTCLKDVDELRMNPEANALRDKHNADIVVLFQLGNVWPASSLVEGCVPDDFEDPDSDSGFTIIRLEKVFSSPLFRHEIGHVFRAGHNWDNKPLDSEDQYCHYAHRLEQTNYFTSVYEGGSGNILHYSDPKINFQGIPTGLPRDTFATEYVFNDRPERNNAAIIRTNGCIVSNYRESQNINTTLDVVGMAGSGTDDCILELNSLTQPFNSEYEYIWNWSYDGVFTEEFPSEFLGVGNNIIVDEPVNDPCETYFIQSVILFEGEIVEIEVVSMQGAICIDFVDDPCEESTQGYSIANGQNYNVDESVRQDGFDENVDFDNIRKVIVFDVLGRRILEVEDRNDLLEIESDVKSQYKGLFYIVLFGQNGKSKISKHVSL